MYNYLKKKNQLICSLPLCEVHIKKKTHPVCMCVFLSLCLTTYLLSETPPNLNHEFWQNVIGKLGIICWYVWRKIFIWWLQRDIIKLQGKTWLKSFWSGCIFGEFAHTIFSWFYLDMFSSILLHRLFMKLWALTQKKFPENITWTFFMLKKNILLIWHFNSVLVLFPFIFL